MVYFILGTISLYILGDNIFGISRKEKEIVVNLLLLNRVAWGKANNRVVRGVGFVETINDYIFIPPCFICNRAQSIQILPSNGGGVLYPYGVLCKDSYEVEKIKELCLRADDLWMMFMALQNGTKTVKTRKYHRTFSVIGDSQEVQLATGNIVNNAYLKFLDNMINAYPDAWSRIINS